MVSTLKLTKIQIPNSDSDVLSFNSSTGIMTFHKDITGEGTATTNLQQGLAKVLASLDTSGTAEIDNSFNLTSITDNGTGDHTLNITNALSSAFSYCSFMCAANASFDDEGSAHIIARATDTHRFGITDIHNAADAFDYDPVMFTIHGDLA